MADGLRYRYLTVVLAAGLMLLGGCASEPQPVLVREGGQWVEVLAVEGTARGELALIMQYMKDEEYGEVISAAEKFRENYPVDYRREDVSMLAGHAEMERGNYISAHEWYTRQLNEFPGGDLSDEALDREYRIADEFLDGRNQKLRIYGTNTWILQWFSAHEEGIEILTGVAERSPTSTLAEDALLRIAEYYYADEQWLQAAEAYDQYLAIFPKRRRSGFARLRAARAVYATYWGAAYDSTPLIDAGLRFRAFAAAHPAEARAEGIDKVLARIAEQRAAADIHVAELFERLDRPEAAAFYYNQAAKRYGHTALTPRAEAAVKRLTPPPAAPKAEP